MQIKPLHSMVLLEEIKSNQTNFGGIEVKQKSNNLKTAKVIEIGESAKNQLSKNDTVYFLDFATTTICCETKNYLLINIYDILAVAK